MSYYAGIIFDAFKTYYAQNHADIVSASLLKIQYVPLLSIQSLQMVPCYEQEAIIVTMPTW